MKITLPGHGQWLVRCFLAVLFAVSIVRPASSQDVDHEPDVVVRGQSPYVGGWNQSLPAESTIPFSTASSPWIVVSQETAPPPQSYATSPYRMAQLPSDPFGQPYAGGAPGYGDPSLSGMFMDTPAIWQPYVAAQGKGGNYSSGAFGQLMMPLYQDGQSLIFADIRGRWDDSSNSEGNFGLAARTMIDPTWFVGLYGFYDYRRTSYGNNFNQGTIGVEGMSVRYEARLNGYIPESTAKAANSLSGTELIGNTIFVKGGFERAYYGVDGEIGALLWDDGIGNHEFRGFVGGYWYDTSGKDFPSIAGPKGRLEFRCYDLPWFGPESRLTLGVELQHDNVRDTQVSGIARLEIPLGFFQGTRKLTRLERRMLDRIVRDDDIITVAQQGAREVGRDSLTNRLLNNVTFVDKNTANIPLTVATAANPATSTVVVDGHAGVITTNTAINLQAGQVFRGGGFKVIGSETGAIATFGTRPTINNTNLAANTVVMANNSTVADLNLIGGLNGVSSGGANLDGIRVSGNLASNAKNTGFEFAGLNTTVNNKIDNNIARSNGRDANGILIPAANGFGFHFTGPFAGTLQGNIAENNFGIGYLFDGNMTGTVVGNTASGNGVNPDGTITTFRDGFFFGGTMTGTVNANIASSNSGTGFFFMGSVSGGVNNNSASGNGRKADGTLVNIAHGFDFFAALPNTAILSGNTAFNNGGHGYLFEQAVSGKITGNIATRNDDDGFEFDGALAAGSFLTGNTSTANGRDAVGAIVNGAADGYEFNAAIAGTVTGNTATSNADDGFDGSVGSIAATGVFSQNNAANNGSFGFNMASFAAGSLFNSNVATNNVLDGYLFNGALAGTVNGNSATGSGITGSTIINAASNGFSLAVPNTGTFTNNTAFGNANNGFAGTDDNNFTNAAAGTFSNNVSNQNGDRGYRGTNAGTANNNTGAGNLGTPPGNTFP